MHVGAECTGECRRRRSGDSDCDGAFLTRTDALINDVMAISTATTSILTRPQRHFLNAFKLLYYQYPSSTSHSF